MKCYNITILERMSYKLLSSTLFAAAALTASTSAFATHYPFTIDNCGQKNTYEHAPERVVTIGQHETELMLALGLKDKIVGTSVWFGPLPKAYSQDATSLKRLSDNSPSFEAVLGQKPDLVEAQYTYHVGKQGEVATRGQFEDLGVHTWISPSDCVGKGLTDSSNSDGARSVPFSVDLLYREITDLAKIFNVEAQGKALNAQLAQRIEKAQKAANSSALKAKDTKVVFWFSSSRLKGDAWVAGNSGAPEWIADALGLDNVVDSNQEWPAVSWETIAADNPDYIVLAKMDRRLYPADDIKKKIAFLKNDPVTKQMTAIKQNHIIVVPAMSLNPSLRNVDAVEQIGQKIGQMK